MISPGQLLLIMAQVLMTLLGIRDAHWCQPQVPDTCLLERNQKIMLQTKPLKQSHKTYGMLTVHPCVKTIPEASTERKLFNFPNFQLIYL